jgi:hypothetical protein
MTALTNEKNYQSLGRSRPIAGEELSTQLVEPSCRESNHSVSCSVVDRWFQA